jgi:hypothetical protein
MNIFSLDRTLYRHLASGEKLALEFNLFGANPRRLLAKSHSQTSENPSFPNASIGNPDETLTGSR